jgi:tetratricopeptide (TPR) repeat protein
MNKELDSIKIETNKLITNVIGNSSDINFTGRLKELEYLKKLFETNQYVYVYGESGSGKTSLAHEYIRNLRIITNNNNNNNQTIIRWIESSSLLNSFKCLAHELDINLSSQPKSEELFHKIKLKLNQFTKSNNLSLLFIIDNLVYNESDEFLNDFKYLINNFSLEIQFLITTKHINFLHHLNHSTNNVQFQLSLFDSNDCLEFVHKKLSKIHQFKLTNHDWIKFILLKDNKILPIYLVRLISRINQEIFWKTENIKEYLLEANNNNININLALIKEENPKAFEILAYLTYLNQDSISFNFLSNLFNDMSENDLSKYLEYLNYNSEIILNDDSTFSMNDDETRKIMSKQIDLNKIINTLDNLISYEKINEYKLDTRMNEYFNHSVKILSINDDENEYTMFNIKKIQLLDKIAKINEIILCKYNKALEYFEKSLNVCQKTLPENHLLTTLSLNNIGSIYYNKNEYDKALEYYSKSFNIYKSILPANSCEIAECFNNIGSIYYKKNDFTNALDYFEKSLAIFQISNDIKNELDASTCFKNIASIYYKLSEYEKSLDYYEKSLKIKKEHLPANHFSIGVNMNNIGSIYYNKNEYDKSLEYYEETLKIWNQILPANHPEIVQCFNNIGLVYFKKGNYDKALDNYFKCLAIEKENLSSNNENHGESIATYYDNIGLIFNYKGDLDKAIEYYENSLLIYKQILSDKDDLIVLTNKNIENLKETKRLSQINKIKNDSNNVKKKKSLFKCCLFRF